MFVHQLLDLPVIDYKKGFRLLPKGRVIWKSVHVDGDRKRIRVSRTVKVCVGLLEERRQYVKPMTEVEIVT